MIWAKIFQVIEGINGVPRSVWIKMGYWCYMTQFDIHAIFTYCAFPFHVPHIVSHSFSVIPYPLKSMPMICGFAAIRDSFRLAKFNSANVLSALLTIFTLPASFLKSATLALLLWKRLPRSLGIFFVIVCCGAGFVTKDITSNGTVSSVSNKISTTIRTRKIVILSHFNSPLAKCYWRHPGLPSRNYGFEPRRQLIRTLYNTVSNPATHIGR